MKLYIKHMVSLRCKILVKNEVEKVGLHCVKVDLGMVEIRGSITQTQREELKKNLQEIELVLVEDKKNSLSEKIKTLINETIDNADELPKVNYPDYISGKLDNKYIHISKIFSETNLVTIQHYIIINKIEKVKELLLSDQLTLSEIAFQLNYSSTAHLSNQFKKITGLAPSYYKELKQKRQN